MGQATDSLTRSLAQAGDQAALQAYQGERQNQMGALGQVPAFSGLDYQNLAAMLQAGGMLDTKAQQNLNDAIARYNYEQTAQPNWYVNAAQQLLSMYPGGSTTGNNSASSTYMPPGNPTESGIGAGLAGLGTVAQLLSIPGVLPVSDQRLKTDVRPVGKTFDGQNIYSYRLLGEPHHQIGLMAQEVEKKHPAAVATDPAGWKHVDYRRATSHAAAGGLF